MVSFYFDMVVDWDGCFQVTSNAFSKNNHLKDKYSSETQKFYTIKKRKIYLHFNHLLLSLAIYLKLHVLFKLYAFWKMLGIGLP